MLNLSGENKLPSILQAESAECGLACIAMIASYHGYRCDLLSLRRNFGSSARGATIQTIIDLADSLELTTRAVRLGIEELVDLSAPAILHWNFNHFVVLKQVSRRSIVIHDPAVGVRKYSLKEVSQRFTGIALELSPRSTFVTGSEHNKLKIWDFWRGAKGLTSSLVQILVLSLLIQLFTLATPFYVQLVVDEVLVKHDADLLLVLVLGFAALTLISVATKTIRGFSSIYLTNQLSYNLGNSVMHHLIRLPMDYFQKRHLGDVISRFDSVKPIQNFITNGSISIVIDGLLAMTTLAMMYVYSTKLTLVVLVSATLYGIFRALQFRPLRNSNHEVITSVAKLDSLFMESIRSLQSIKLAGRESQRESAWRNQFAESLTNNARIGRLTVSYEAVNNTLTGLEYLLVVYLGAKEVMGGLLSIGMLYAFMSYRYNFSAAVTSIINQVMQYWMVGLHLERVSDITNSELEAGLESERHFTIPISGEIELKRVSFTYTGSKLPIFENLSLQIPAGNFVALYGPSGSGKSTLLNVLMGLSNTTDGQILVDGQPLSKTILRSYRGAISAVTQEDELFSGSLKDNITFFDLSADADRILQAARHAEIHEDILRMTMGYESLIGDMGTALSEGQQQRLLLARALYNQPRILFLDEGTAHIDAQIEMKIMDTLKSLNITCIYVTHNPNLLQYADQVIQWHHGGDIEVSNISGIAAGS
ncbi:MAG: peptidase domain-containing ABC transporter [Gammaproteobacteria bacterium]|nr:peptidase domain-containing ABC transporter [Gammaproteobacteria bacterium]